MPVNNWAIRLCVRWSSIILLLSLFTLHLQRSIYQKADDTKRKKRYTKNNLLSLIVCFWLYFLVQVQFHKKMECICRWLGRRMNGMLDYDEEEPIQNYLLYTTTKSENFLGSLTKKYFHKHSLLFGSFFILYMVSGKMDRIS